jgi:CP family cyanate transporter-like MFS transporter
MLLGLAFGVVADGLGARRSMLLGLGLLALRQRLGGGIGQRTCRRCWRCACWKALASLLVALPAPGLAAPAGAAGPREPGAGRLGRLHAAGHGAGAAARATGAWPRWAGAPGGGLLAGVSLAMARLAGLQAVPAAVLRPAPPASPRANRRRRQAPPPGLRALAPDAGRPRPLAGGAGLCRLFEPMAGGDRLPAVHLHAGRVSGAATGVLTALAAAVNIVGNVGSGRLLQRGAHAPWLLATGFGVMALAAAAAFAQGAGPGRLGPATGIAVCGGAAVFRRRRH